jgi:hypothetical protein
MTIARPLSPSQSRPVPRRCLSRTEAAMYVGISESKFGELIVAGQMPRPFTIGTRKLWDIHKLDMAIDELSGEDSPPVSNSWDGR